MTYKKAWGKYKNGSFGGVKVINFILGIITCIAIQLMYNYRFDIGRLWRTSLSKLGIYQIYCYIGINNRLKKGVMTKDRKYVRGFWRGGYITRKQFKKLCVKHNLVLDGGIEQ